MKNRKFVTAFNGARDFYMLPLALHENGMLDAHISDFTTQNHVVYNYLPTLGNMLSLRIKSQIPSTKIKINYYALARNIINKLRKNSAQKKISYYDIDRSFSRLALNHAIRNDCDLFLHSGYAYWAFKELEGTNKERILFQFHPHQEYVFDLLEKDVTTHPEIIYSYQTEEDSQSTENTPRERLDEWRYADRIFCASAFTKETLIYAGCSTEKIAVVPYGAFKKSNDLKIENAKENKCVFLFVGQGIQRKGIHHLLKAWNNANLKNSELILVCKHLDPGVVPLINYENTTVKRGLSSIELLAQYQHADCFVMPSLIEGFGLVYLEALNNGLHCIGTKNTGLPDLHLTRHEVSLVDVGNVNQIEDALGDFEKRFFKREIDKNIIRQSIQSFSWENYRQGIVRNLVTADNQVF